MHPSTDHRNQHRRIKLCQCSEVREMFMEVPGGWQGYPRLFMRYPRAAVMSKDNSLTVMQLQTYVWSKVNGCLRADGHHTWDSL